MPAPSLDPFKIAAVQHASVFLDREATIEKACGLIAEAAREGARIIVFPEAFVPGYPDWVWSVPASERPTLSTLYAELLENAVDVPGPACDRLGRAAREAGALVVIGVNERNAEASGTSLYNTLLFFDASGRLLGKRRKLMPTGGERLVWAQGDGSTLEAFDTPYGRLAGMICWENYMPLARYAMYASGVQLYLAPTWDRGEPWLATLRHIAREGRVFVVGCCMAVRMEDIPDRYEFKRDYPAGRKWVNVGDSAIVSPDGAFLAGPMHETQGILYARIDPRQALGSRAAFDAAGHYARPDVFELTVRRDARPMLRESSAMPREAQVSGNGSGDAPAAPRRTARRPVKPRRTASRPRARSRGR